MDIKKLYLNKFNSLGGIKPSINMEKENSVGKKNISEKVKQVEQYIKSQIPKDYLCFLKEIQAFTFKESVITKGVDKIPVAGNKNTVSVSNFFDLFDSKESLIQKIKLFEGNIPNYALPICEGEAGDLIIIDTSKKNCGKVYYWFHEHNDETDGLYLLANDFEKFISNLFVDINSETENSVDDVTITNITDKFLKRLKKSGKAT